jgi:hypothetical protein
VFGASPSPAGSSYGRCLNSVLGLHVKILEDIRYAFFNAYTIERRMPLPLSAQSRAAAKKLGSKNLFGHINKVLLLKFLDDSHLTEESILPSLVSIA